MSVQTASEYKPQQIIHFWFEEISPKAWWVKDPEFDNTIERRFGALLHAARQGELWHWRQTPQGRLAEILLLDQFSRNIHRDTPDAFSADPMALALAQEAISIGADKQLQAPMLAFLYMPFMHSESAVIHQQAQKLFASEQTRDNYDFELRHKAIIDRFGRYPHRNAILGRQSTAEELAFLEQPGSSF
ncbi:MULTISPECIES: DUF924 family protein [Shewanella]|uniref:DUF924 domain-containing protein n=1 Tax=Shewanella algae TaxID=38313 RepID=A0A7T8IR08_9GAMM|nr:DUF924 family protein [Shewanella algae]MBO2592378.1 DUF924 domain-containing protein [Shewanella algae]MBO2697809.1 DUF924 domain-containing protein [Shewanella algae]QQO85027.1 DUF924 domain-containing protein [Shewanella algae]QTE90139.1 DUF924 domain-containing protein [Shewanella algae]HEW9975835.1 DUF924 domain-containing protein [Shewanella algae]